MLPSLMLLFMYFRKCYHHSCYCSCTSGNVTITHVIVHVLQEMLPSLMLLFMYFRKCYHHSCYCSCTSGNVTITHVIVHVLQEMLPSLMLLFMYFRKCYHHSCYCSCTSGNVTRSAINQRAATMFDEGTKPICFVATVWMPISPKEEALQWVQEFEEKSFITWRKKRTIRKCLVAYNHLSCNETNNCSAGYVCDKDYVHVKC